MARFDWYQATVEQPPLWLRGALQEAAGGVDRTCWQDGRPLSRYGRCEVLVGSDGGELLQLHSGGGAEWPHVLATGAAADRAAHVLRSVAPRHLVSRGDVCEDLDAEGWFDQAHRVLLDVAKERRMKPRVAGDWFGGSDAGRTAYLGSPTSAVIVRVYEKGLELRGKYPKVATEISPTWARMEVQVRPAKRAAKLQMARVDASDWWGCSSYSQMLADRLLGNETPRLKVGTIYRAADLDRAEQHMITQYGKVFQAMHDRLGSWEAVGRYIGERLDPQREPMYEAVREWYLVKIEEAVAQQNDMLN